MVCGATCWTDHKLVRAKLRLDLCCTHCRNGRRPAPIDVQRFADPLIQQFFVVTCQRVPGR